MSPTLELSTESVIENSTNTTTIPTTPSKRTIVDSSRDVVEQNSSKSQCSSLSDGENYEWNGEGVDIDGDSGIITTDKSGRCVHSHEYQTIF